MEKENIYAKRIDQVQMSSIRVVMEKVEKLKSQGKSVVSLCAGEPDFNTPEGIKKATIEALNNNQTHYSSNRGYLGLRQKVAQLLKEQTTVDYDSDQEIIMTCGCSEAINNACLAFIEPGDEVIIFTPAFVSYQNTVLLCEGIPVEIPLKASNEFQIDIEELKSKITNKTKMMIINNPSNPTGAVYQKETLEKVCQLARENNILILADEIYNQLDYEKQYVIGKRTLEENGFNIYGFITAGGGDWKNQDFQKSRSYAEKAGYLYADLTTRGCDIYDKRYYNPRNGISDSSVESGAVYAKFDVVSNAGRLVQSFLPRHRRAFG